MCADKEAAGGYREVMLNRPKALNALNLNMIRLIQPQMKAAASDPSVAMVVMEGEALYYLHSNLNAFILSYL